MAYTTTDLQNIQQALASGKRRVRIGLREIEYQSIDAMMKIEEKIIAELNRESATIKRPAAFRARTSKGL